MSVLPMDVDETDINVKDIYGRAAIHRACGESGDNLDIFKIQNLISLGADVNLKTEKNAFASLQTPLHLAADADRSGSHQTVIYILLKNGANINAQDRYGNTVLHRLVSEKEEFIKMLLHFQADVNLENIDGEIPLFKAISNQADIEIIKLLVKEGSNINKHKSQYNPQNYTHCAEETPIHLACEAGNKDVINLLLENGANINELDSRGRIPLIAFLQHLPCDSRTKMTQTWVLEFLLEHSDLDLNVGDSGYEVVAPSYKQEAIKVFWPVIIEHLAIRKQLNLPINSTFLNSIVKKSPEFQNYFDQCTAELVRAGNLKLHNSWVTYLNLLLEHDKKLRNYAGNRELVNDFRRIQREKQFPIFKTLAQNRMTAAIDERLLSNKALNVLSSHLPVFNPTHLVIRDITDCLTYSSLSNLVWGTRPY